MRIAKLFRSFVHVIGEYPIFFLLFLATITIRRNADGVFDTSVNQHVAHFDRQKSLKTSTDFCWIRIWTLSGHLDDGTCLIFSNFMNLHWISVLTFGHFCFCLHLCFHLQQRYQMNLRRISVCQKNRETWQNKNFLSFWKSTVLQIFLNFHKIDKKMLFGEFIIFAFPKTCESGRKIIRRKKYSIEKILHAFLVDFF